jgi:hypothetical protein
MHTTHMIISTVLALLPTIWIVDASNGPGTNFTNLPPAVAAAASGDTIVVRAGSYSAFTVTGKALTIRGAGASTTLVQMLGSPNGDTRINNAPAGTTFYLSGLKFAPPSTTLGPVVAGLSITGARVTLADVIVQGTSVGTFSGIDGTPGLRVLTSAEVHLTRCTVSGGNGVGWYGGPALYAAGGCYLAINASTLTAGSQNYNGTGASGIFLSGGFATLSRSSVFGASNPFGPGGHGISVASGGFVRVAGLATNVVQAGSGPGALAYAIVADPTSSAVVHGGVTLTSSGGVSGAVVVGAVELPYVSITGTTMPGGELTGSQPVTISFAGVIPSTWFLLGVDLAPSFITPPSSIAVGELLISYPPAIVVQDNLNAAGLLQFSMIPAIDAPSLLGIPIYFQFGVFDQNSGQYRLSNGDVRIFQ